MKKGSEAFSRWIGLVFVFYLFFGFNSKVYSEYKDVSEEAKLPEVNYRDVKTPEGLIFHIPEDMPIEKNSGLTRPMPFEEYMFRKLKKMDARIKETEDRIEDLEKRMKLEEEKT